MQTQTKTITQNDFIDFLGELVVNSIDPHMANTVIAQFGGWQEFTENAMDFFVRGGRITPNDKRRKFKVIKGWDSELVASDFYTKNKNDILNLAKSRTDSQEAQTVVELVSDFSALNGEYDLDAVAVGMHVLDCAEYPVVSSALACFAANEVVYAYNVLSTLSHTVEIN